ncbi:hypothetical protein ACJ41O_001195 [Fusarium nematophilum]
MATSVLTRTEIILPDTVTTQRIRPPSILSLDHRDAGVDTDTHSAEGNNESSLNAWLCVLGAFTFVIPSFGFMQSVGTIQSYLKFNQLEGYSTGDIGWITG